eukprot:TRINITY_DN3928_c0_g3_i1.p1 TRINITY_DN3928_c0_g3~~TRINITY_DN3928_c0_g3_i1.p1  ORF type:complete len:301 (+),score=80.48 TRINITY_DN3928_c0_g3_i1:15-917(+)
MQRGYVDATKQDCVNDEQIKFFEEKGYLVVKNLISESELTVLREETQDIIQQRNIGVDFWYNDDIPQDWYNNYKDINNNSSPSPPSSSPSSTSLATPNKGVPFRVEYVIDKMPSCRRLSAIPFLLRSIEKMQGPNFIPTWDSMVFKMAGEGVPVKWHRDASASSIGGGYKMYTTENKGNPAHFPPPIDVGIYLDAANTKLGNCIYAIPGSQKWDDQLAAVMITHLVSQGFKTGGAMPIEVEPGDMIMHNILVLHGSPACSSPLRRTVYYEFRAAEAEQVYGPHTKEYTPLKQKNDGVVHK